MKKIDRDFLIFAKSGAMTKDSYAAVKKQFEINNFIVLHPLSYCSLVSEDGQPVLHKTNKTNFKNMYETLKCHTGELPRKPFLKLWFKDPERREYLNFGFIPPPLICPDSTYNLFTGFKYQTLKAKPDDNIEIFLNHLRLLAGEELTEEVHDYLVKYLAHLIQYPGILPEVAIMMKSVQGIGKNLFFESFGRRVLGEQYMLSTSKSEQIVGRFNLINQKFLVCYDEAKGSETHKADNIIKTLITQPKLNWEQKCQDAVLLPNFVRMLFFSNPSNENPVKIELKDRRFQVIESSSKLGTKEYYRELDAAFKNDGKILGFVNYLKGIDLSGWHAEKSRVTTSLHTALASSNLSHYDKFLRDALYTRSIQFAPNKMRPLDFYSRYKDWISKKDWNSQTNTAFGLAMKKYKGVQKLKVKGLLYYRVDLEELTNGLLESKIINEDEHEGITNCVVEAEDDEEPEEA